MNTGSMNDMMADIERRIDELESGITSSADVLSDYDTGIVNCYFDPDGMFGDIGETISEADLRQIFEDCHDDDPVMCEYDSFESWIEDTVAHGYLQPCDDIDASCEACESITAAIDNEYTEQFCARINDEIVGSSLDVDDVECQLEGNTFVITVTLDSGEECEFNVPLSDLTCDIETISDDFDYVVGEIEAELS